jgi:hypothetical protein
MRGWPYWNSSRTVAIETTAPSATIQPTRVKPAIPSARASGGHGQVLVWNQPREHDADHDVDQRADGEPAENANRQVPLRIARLSAAVTSKPM